MRTALEVDLLAVPKAVSAVRRTVREHLGTESADVQLCVSEMLSNVILHLGEGTPVTLRVTERGGGLTRIEVTDPDTASRVVCARAACDDESGRGLALLEAVSLRWGVERNGSGKTVWCELRDG